MRALKASVADRLASASWQGMLAFSLAASVVGGAWFGHLRTGSVSGMLLYGFGYMVCAGLFVLAKLRRPFAPLSGLSPADRRTVIDAVRFGQPVGAPHLVEPLLAYTATAAKRASRANVTAGTALLGVTCGFSVYVAIRSAQVGSIGTALTFAAVAVGLALWTAVWPEVGRACRRKIEAARQTATDLERDPDRLVASAPR